MKNFTKHANELFPIVAVLIIGCVLGGVILGDSALKIFTLTSVVVVSFVAGTLYQKGLK